MRGLGKNMKNKKGLFIAFEGIDGCGKSTQIKKFVDYLFNKDKHNHIVLTRNPYRDTEIRATIRQDSNPESEAEKLASLFIEDRKKQVEEIVIQNLENGHFVVTDRYKLSTITYQSAQGLGMQELIDRHKDLPVPDMTFIIDVSAEEAANRMQKEKHRNEHKFEANLDFSKKLREKHNKAKEILEKQGEKIFVINGEKTPEEVFEEVKRVFEGEVGK